MEFVAYHPATTSLSLFFASYSYFMPGLYDYVNFLYVMHASHDIIVCNLFCSRYTDRRKSAIHHFKQALTIDPSMWAAYEELCVLGLDNVTHMTSYSF